MVPLTKLKYLVAYWLSAYSRIFIIFIRFSLQIYWTISYDITKRILKYGAYNFYAFHCAFSWKCIFVSCDLSHSSALFVKLKIYNFKQILLSDSICIFDQTRHHLNWPWSFSVQLFNLGINIRRILLSFNEKLLCMLYSIYHGDPFQTDGSVLCFCILWRTNWVNTKRFSR